MTNRSTLAGLCRLSSVLSLTLSLLLTAALLSACGGNGSNNALEQQRSAFNRCIGQPDSDGDGLCNILETEIGTSPSEIDTDLDDLPDSVDTFPTGGTTTGNGESGSEPSATERALITVGSLLAVDIAASLAKSFVEGISGSVSSIFSSSSGAPAAVCNGINSESSDLEILECLRPEDLRVDRERSFMRICRVPGADDLIMTKIEGSHVRTGDQFTTVSIISAQIDTRNLTVNRQAMLRTIPITQSETMAEASTRYNRVFSDVEGSGSSCGINPAEYHGVYFKRERDGVPGLAIRLDPLQVMGWAFTPGASGQEPVAIQAQEQVSLLFEPPTTQPQTPSQCIIPVGGGQSINGCRMQAVVPNANPTTWFADSAGPANFPYRNRWNRFIAP